MRYPSKKIPAKVKKKFLRPELILLLQGLGAVLVWAAFMLYSEWNVYKLYYLPPLEIQLAPGIPPRRQWNCTVHPDQCPDPAVLHIRTIA